jgi:hypothetical protein
MPWRWAVRARWALWRSHTLCSLWPSGAIRSNCFVFHLLLHQLFVSLNTAHCAKRHVSNYVLLYSTVGILTDYGLDARGLITCRSKRLFFTASRLSLGPSQTPIQLLESKAGGVKLTIHIHVAPRSRILELHIYHHSSIRFHGVVSN